MLADRELILLITTITKEYLAECFAWITHRPDTSPEVSEFCLRDTDRNPDIESISLLFVCCWDVIFMDYQE